MPKISTLPITTELTGDDLILVTDNPSGRPRTRQATVNVLATFTASVVPEASTSGAGLLSVEFYNLLSGSTANATPGTLVRRDTFGRFKSAEPLVSSDVATKSYVDTTLDILEDKTVKIYKQTVTGPVTTFNIDHNFGTRDVVVQVYDLATYDSVFVDVVRPTINQVQVIFSSAPGSSSYRVLVQGIQN